MLTTAAIAKIHRCTSRNILKIAEKRGVEPLADTGRTKVWGEDQVELLKPEGWTTGKKKRKGKR